MSLENYIINDIEIRNPEETIGDLQKLLKDLNYTHIPMGKDGIYLGSLSVNDLLTFEADKTLGEHQYALEGFFVRNTVYWLETLDVFARNQTNILPVLSLDNKYLGYLELADIINNFNKTPFLSEPGGIIVFEKGSKDYSFSEIAQIIESHNAVLFGLFISGKTEGLTQITAKLSSTGLNEILQTLRRYGYTVISEHQEDSFNQSIDDRSEYLDKYLKI
ncbi:CBS domain-containing protein [Gillisia limnaea]|uniref:CBS domain-containing protein n=1 Tax=Gillisia limnaea (strain DSM 15749 / LMG 21470 / R-8282) TaxID=865937 RepID=H2BYZ6_GILLR|nr:CBS domain-containing protein [Gillisia limnaea]EHQ03341.1 CBS domain-containing protein [Gillisia limnaea DSM 15749]